MTSTDFEPPAAFEWRKLTPGAAVSYRLDERGRLIVRGTPHAPPFGVSSERAVPSTWSRADEPDGWVLRTQGQPRTVTRLLDTFGDLANEVANAAGSDPRILLVQAACEAAFSSTHPSGKDLRSPRTEPGYPRRRNDADPGDPLRDAEDWRISRGAHSSHGLTQCLIRTATAVRPDLFDSVDPRRHREVLWRPENAFACLAALHRSLPAKWHDDPLAVRVVFGAGGVHPSVNRWGARVYADGVILHWIAFWNDLAAVLEERGDTSVDVS